MRYKKYDRRDVGDLYYFRPLKRWVDGFEGEEEALV